MAAESKCGTVGAIHKPKRSRWRSTAAIAAAVTASTICLREGAEAASEPCTVLDIARSCTVLDTGAREGRRCVTRGLKILGGNDGVSPSVSAAWNITGGTCRRSRSVLRGCGAESLSEPEKVVRLEFPRPLECSSRRRWPVGAELSLAEEDSDRLARLISNVRRVSRSQCSPGRVPQAASRRSRRRSVAFTTCSLSGVLPFVARARARSRRYRLPVRLLSPPSFWHLLSAHHATTSPSRVTRQFAPPTLVGRGTPPTPAGQPACNADGSLSRAASLKIYV